MAAVAPPPADCMCLWRPGSRCTHTGRHAGPAPADAKAATRICIGWLRSGGSGCRSSEACPYLHPPPELLPAIDCPAFFSTALEKPFPCEVHCPLRHSPALAAAISQAQTFRKASAASRALPDGGLPSFCWDWLASPVGCPRGVGCGSIHPAHPGDVWPSLYSMLGLEAGVYIPPPRLLLHPATRVAAGKAKAAAEKSKTAALAEKAAKVAARAEAAAAKAAAKVAAKAAHGGGKKVKQSAAACGGASSDDDGCVGGGSDAVAVDGGAAVTTPAASSDEGRATASLRRLGLSYDDGGIRVWGGDGSEGAGADDGADDASSSSPPSDAAASLQQRSTPAAPASNTYISSSSAFTDDSDDTYMPVKRFVISGEVVPLGPSALRPSDLAASLGASASASDNEKEAKLAPAPAPHPAPRIGSFGPRLITVIDWESAPLRLVPTQQEGTTPPAHTLPPPPLASKAGGATPPLTLPALCRYLEGALATSVPGQRACGVALSGGACLPFLAGAAGVTVTGGAAAACVAPPTAPLFSITSSSPATAADVSSLQHEIHVIKPLGAPLGDAAATAALQALPPQDARYRVVIHGVPSHKTGQIQHARAALLDAILARHEAGLPLAGVALFVPPAVPQLDLLADVQRVVDGGLPCFVTCSAAGLRGLPGCSLSAAAALPLLWPPPAAALHGVVPRAVPSAPPLGSGNNSDADADTSE